MIFIQIRPRYLHIRYSFDVFFSRPTCRCKKFDSMLQQLLCNIFGTGVAKRGPIDGLGSLLGFLPALAKTPSLAPPPSQASSLFCVYPWSWTVPFPSQPVPAEG